ncbi:phage terminase small subunit P27 family [Cohnella sp. GbtcB17]|uniref:phage terminase small subunit P27 family n=1 Tax=Cohnella sp. GbtcB17 TaxID=2824762 RepID=UPI001C30A4F6|nr:phage terminase small subunit P27 family [Cohnella sp. GbtcB17]
MNKVIAFDHMRVGAKGGGKHWTEKEVKNREEAAKKFKRKKRVSLKYPDWMGEEARKVWNKTVKDMKDFEILDTVDEEVLAVYCDSVVKLRQLNFAIDNDGFTIEEKDGAHVPNPNVNDLVRMAQSYQRLVLQYAGKLGITAEARARLAKKMADVAGAGGGGGKDDLLD